jgi:hypothetical protein
VVQEANALPSVVVFRDSFFTQLVKFVAVHFRRSAFYWQEDFDRAVIEAEQPDLVLQEIVERNLNELPPAPFLKTD